MNKEANNPLGAVKVAASGVFQRMTIGAAALIGAVVLAQQPAWSSLIGDEIGGCVRPQLSSSCPADNEFTSGLTATVVGGPSTFEFDDTPLGPVIALKSRGADFDASTLIIRYVIAGTLFPFEDSIFEFSDLDWRAPDGALIPGIITDVTFDAVASTLMASVQSVGPHSFSILVPACCSFFTDTSAFFDIHTSHIPEPGTLALFAFGLAGLGFMTWRRRNRRTQN